jgi:ribosomal protein L30
VKAEDDRVTEGDAKKTTKRTTAKKSTKTSRAKKETTTARVSKAPAEPDTDVKAKATEKKAKRSGSTRPKAAGGRRLRVKQIRSTIHRQKRFLRTLSALGLKHHQDEVVVVDSPSVQGMLNQVRTFVRVTPEDG